MSKKHEINMTEGSILKNLLRFSIPLILTGILQLMYNAADMIVVGRFAGSNSLAAVGSTSSLYNLIINLFIGMGAGGSVLVSIAYGSKDYQALHRTVHTSIAISIVAGIFCSILGIVACKPMLTLMGSPADVIEKSTLYMRILFLGIPALMIYNFGSSILRSVGDTKRPLYFLIFSGALNVVVNLITVIVFKMDVAGVAIATVLSNYVSAVLILICLATSSGPYRLYAKKIRFYKKEFLQFLRIGLPAGIQSTLFSISNVLIQSSINLFGAAAMAGSSVSGNIESFAYIVMNSIYQASITACGQNLGAKNIKRIKKSAWCCLGVVTGAGILMSSLMLSIKDVAFSLFTTDAEVLRIATLRLYYMIIPYTLVGIMEVTAGIMRGLKYSILPMTVSLIGACGFRIFWIYTFFQLDKTLGTLFLSYPISWLLTAMAHGVCIIFAIKKYKKQFESEGILC